MDGVGFDFERKDAEQEVGFMEESVDYFSVDDLLLDFPLPETTDSEPEVAVSEECKPCVSVKFTDVSGIGFSPSEISVPADDVAELEWLSHFVEDSFSEYSLAYPAVKLPEKTKHGLETFTPALFPTPLTKPRTKRCRSSGKSWNLSTSDAATSSSSSGSASSSLPNTPLKPLIAKRLRRGRLGSGGTQGGRRCSHCGVQRTPQWRAGPDGLKTLCNACGVRFKSGRLCPEYRPACSPTFSSDLHSNNHRKVVEMRRRKVAGLAPALNGIE